MSTTAKKHSKFFRIGVEGATTDGRRIDRDWLVQMAKQYNRGTFGARVNLEHYKGIIPDGPFRAYGDVLALKAEEVEVGGQKKMALFAQIEPTIDLIEMTKKRQKIYTSMEVNPKFADTGEAYLVGLAVTDNPASLGTDALEFAASKPAANPWAARKTDKDNVISEVEEVSLEFVDAPDDAPGISAKFSAKIDSLKQIFTGKAKTDEAKLDAVVDALEDVGTAFAGQATELAKATATIADQGKTIATLSTQVKALQDSYAALDNTPVEPKRPAANGGNGTVKTDC